MTHKTTMPDPVAHMTQSGSRVLTDREARSMQVAGWDRNKHLEYYSVPLISVADAEAYANARVRRALAELRKLSHGAYCRYIDTLYRTECLGWEAKVKDGRFGEREFNAHKKAHEFLGQHRAFAEAIITIRALIPDPPCDT